MANNIVYKMYFDDYNDNECIVYIKKTGYAGAETEVEGGSEPCIVKMMGEGDSKFTHIKATECYIQFVATSSLQYLTLFTSPSKTYWVEVYRGVTLIWIGWVNPEYYSEPFMPPPYIVTIHATDGLAELKNVKFPLPGATRSDYKQTLIYYVSKCLEQIGFKLSTNIWVACNLSATTTADGQVIARLWEYLYIDYRAFRKEGEFWNCYDILVEILSAFNARLYQWGWNWQIERIDQKHTTYDIEKYSGLGVYVTTTSAYDAVTSLTAHVGAGTDIRFIRGASLEVQPAYKGYSIFQEYGSRENILPFSNYEGIFWDEDWINSATLRYWDATGGVETALVEQMTFENIGILKMKPISYATPVPAMTAYIKPSSFGSPGSSYVWISNEGATDETNFVDWMFRYNSLHFNMSTMLSQAHCLYPSGNYYKQHVMFLLDCSGRNYVCWFDSAQLILGNQNDYEWVLTSDPDPAGKINTCYSWLQHGEWVDMSVRLYPPEAEFGVAQTYVGFSVYISSPDYRQEDYQASDGNLIKGVQLYFSDDRDEEKSRMYETTIDDDNILEPEKYEVKFGDTPIPYANDGCGIVNKYVFFDSGGSAVNKFGPTNTPPPMPIYRLISQIIDTDLSLAYRYPLFKLRGTIIDTTDALSFMSILKDYDDRYYFPTGLSYNLKDSTWEGEWLQMYDESGTTGEFNDDFSNDFWI